MIKNKIFFTLTIVSILLTLTFFYFSQKTIESQNQLTVQGMNATLFLSENNFTFSTPSLLTSGIMRAAFRHFLLATEGREPTDVEMNEIQTKEDYIKKLPETKSIITEKLNKAQDMLKGKYNMYSRLSNYTFFASIFIQFCITILDWFTKKNNKNYDRLPSKIHSGKIA